MVFVTYFFTAYFITASISHNLISLVGLLPACFFVFFLTELGERGREFSAKDLMSSVFSAANKKVRRRDRYKGTESIDVELESDVS